MSDVNVSPNMNLPVPVVSSEPGPDWATDVNACMAAIDSHNHSFGQGVPVNPSGIAINADLAMNNNNLTTTRSVNFTVQASPLALASDIGCLYVSGKDLYYNDEDGNQVRVTSGGNVNAGAGSITGLPSGTASVTFAAGTYTFQSATNTPATMAIGPAAIGAAVANSKTVTIAPPNTLAANYSLTLPAALPGSTSLLSSDASGQLGLTPPDNGTFGIQSGTYRVLDNGINTPQLLNGAVTNSKLATLNSAPGTTPGTVNISSTSFVDVTGLTGTITGVGRPVMIVLTSAFDGTLGYIQITDSTATFSMQVLRGATVIQQTQVLFNGGTLNIIPAWTAIDSAPSSGTHIYKIQAKTSSGSIGFVNCAAFFVEL